MSNNNLMKNFITNHINADIKKGNYKELAFRFPPEPNGFLHLGHAKSIILNSYLAKEYGGKLYLRLDDTNPETEKDSYVKAIIDDSKWLSLKEFDYITYTSDYFDDIYNAAVFLIKDGKAYVDLSTEDEIKNSRGGFGKPDKASAYRDASIEANLCLFADMKSGKYKDGSAVLRAKIDLSNPNMNLRDPIMYRIKHMSHYRSGEKWCIYPMYDFAHPLGDCIEKISHSLCTLEFEDHRALYDWYVDNCYPIFNWKPIELEFSRLDIEGVNLSKRKLLNIVETKNISWDNPVMPTISAMRNKGLTPDVLIDFILKCGFSKVNSLIGMDVFEESVRTIHKKADRIFAILDPIELRFETNSIVDTVFIDKSDTMKHPTPDFWRVYEGNWTRLKHGFNFLTKEINDDFILAEVDEGSVDMKLAKEKAKVALHWLKPDNLSKITLKIYSPLIINDTYNPNCVIEKEILIDKSFVTNKVYEFERVGFAYIDDSGVAHLLSYLKNK